MDEFLKVLENNKIGENVAKIIEMTKAIFNGQSLRLLHLQQLPEVEDAPTEKHDQDTAFHKRFYSCWKGEITEHYRSLVEECAALSRADLMEIAYQKVPTFRIQRPGCTATKEFHTDREYNHPLGEIDFIVPLTGMYAATEENDGNSIFIEYAHGLFMNPGLDIGQVLRFDAIRHRHGSLVNELKLSRVSLDFRIIRKVDLPDPESGLRTVNTNQKFQIGDYYTTFRRDW